MNQGQTVVTEAEVFALAARLGAALTRRGEQVATAESCTGGLIARALTEQSGSSVWFERGFVTYSNEAKQELLAVPRPLLAAHGAVSEPVAGAMAQGALWHSRSQLALAVTGIAGPDGGTADKPVGTVCFGWARTSGAVRQETGRFGGDRAQVRLQAARHALAVALEVLGEDRPGADQAVQPKQQD